MFRKIHYNFKDQIQLITPANYLNNNTKLQVSTPNSTSWGANGYSEVWVNNLNDYAAKHILNASKKMEKIAKEFEKENNQLIIRALNQMARELLLLQSSDWLFIITNQTMVEYAHKRINLHTGRFNALYKMVKENNINIPYLTDLELKDNIFEDISYTIYI